MSFFNLRRGVSAAKSSAGATAPAESVEVVRKRARQRLIGAAVLVLLGVIGFPLIFDTQPRPVAVDIPIEIPSRTGAKPLALPAASAEPAAALPSLPAATGVIAPAASLKSDEEIVPPAPKAVPPAVPVPAAKPVVKPEAKPNAEAQRAKALLEAKPAAAPTDLRVVVQVGAFADATKAREARIKLEKAGLKTYTHVAETKDGKRIRVRVGPYPTKAEADKAAAKIKTLDLPAAILTL